MRLHREIQDPSTAVMIPSQEQTNGASIWNDPEDREITSLELSFAPPSATSSLLSPPLRSSGLLFVGVHLVGLISSLMVILWFTHFRGGFGWNTASKDLIFNLHPVLMIVGFIFLHGEANLVYRTIRGTKNYKKTVHFSLQGLAFILGIFGIFAAYKFHNEKGIDNWYSLHSWLGILTATLFAIQWILGFTTFWYPGGGMMARTSLLPWHVFFGLFLYGLALTTAETGILEKLTFLYSNKVIERYGSEALLANMLGIVLCVLGFLVFLSGRRPDLAKHSAHRGAD